MNRSLLCRTLPLALALAGCSSRVVQAPADPTPPATEPGDPPPAVEPPPEPSACEPLVDDGAHSCAAFQALVVEDVALVDAATGGPFVPGSPAALRAVLRETSGYPFMVYPGLTATPLSGLLPADVASDYLYGIFACSEVELHPGVFTVDPSLQSGASIELEVSVTSLGEDECPDVVADSVLATFVVP